MPLHVLSLRPTTRACNGMVSAPHALAAQSGLRILEDGGNAADASITVAASLSVVYPHMTGVGGDAFSIYYDAGSGTFSCYNGSGAAAHLATRERYRDQGLRAIPERGPLAALTVPGAVDAWFALHQRFGSVPMERLLQPAIGYAEHGAPVARSLAESLNVHAGMLQSDDGGAGLYADERLTKEGALLTQPQLGQTLRAIAREGRDWFYRGQGAQHIEAYCRKVGSPLRADDLAAHAGLFCDPARVPFMAFESITTPPNSQGIALLIAQRIVEAHSTRGLPADGSAALLHLMVEAIKLSFRDRDIHVADPQSSPGWDHLLDAEHAHALATSMTPFEASPAEIVTQDRGDTTYFAVVDRHGNAASYIQSLFHGFGAGVVVPELGVVLNNRGCAFSLDEHSLRVLVPGRRPFHTLMPCMLLKKGKPWLVYGSMGGEGQPQTALILSTRIGYFGMQPQAAIEAPRWRWGQTWLDEPPGIHIESRFGAACIAGLRARGHRVHVVDEWEESMGHAGAILMGEDGVLHAGADPRGDGAAVGF